MKSTEQQREALSVRPPEGAPGRISGAIDRLAVSIARHWLAVFSVVVAFFVGVPFMAPVLTHLGSERGCTPCMTAGRLIYTVYSPLCHQLPERSYFLFGPQVTLTLSELVAEGAIPAELNILQRQVLRYRGAPEVGYKVALCERDLAIFGSLLLGGLVFGLARGVSRRRGRAVPRLPLWAYLICLAPMLIDGATQLFGFRESNWLLRTITGMLFGLATVWLAYPYIQEAMDDVVRASRAGQVGAAKHGPQIGQDRPPVL